MVMNMHHLPVSELLIMFAGLARQEFKSKATDPDDLEESGTSGDEYAPPTYSKDDGESEVDDSDLEVDAEVEDEDEEKKSKKGKKPKPTRANIIAKRQVTGASSSLTSTAHTDAKRKATYVFDSLFT